MRALVLASLLLTSSVLAQPTPQPDPVVQALAQMLSEAQQREAAALMRAIQAERRIADAERAKAEPSK